ncbi:Esterase EstB [Thalassocella blandensis]|nr:Esterase EstB [Thalassocella blandensis]
MALFLAACSTTPRSIPSPDITPGDVALAYDYLHDFAQQEIQQGQITGLSLATIIMPQSSVKQAKWQTQEVLRWQDNFGFSHRQQSSRAAVPVVKDTIFRAGSLAKLTNAIAVLMLQDQGKLSLDDAIQQHLPELQIRSRFAQTNITIRHLLTHQSGLPSDWISGMWRQSPEDYHSVIRYINAVYLSQPPGQVFQYSNVAHDVLAIIIERAAQQEYTQFMQEHLFQPLDMQQTSFSAAPLNTAASYDKNKPVQELATRDIAAAGLNTTTEDYGKLLTMLMQAGTYGHSRLLSRTAIQQLTRDYTSDNPLNLGKQYGLSLHYYHDVFATKFPVLGHDGATPGQRALFKFSPELGLGVVLLSNSKNASGALHRIANQALQKLYQVKFGRRIPYPYVHKAQAKPLDQTTNDALSGYYATRLGLAHIYQKNDRLKVRFMGKTFRLNNDPNSDLRFLHYKLFGLFTIDLGYYGRLGLSVRTINGEKYLIGTTNLQQHLLIGKSISPSPIPAKWSKRLGRYTVVNPLEAMTLPSGGLKIQDGFLIAYAKTEEGQRLEFVLQPQNEQQAVVAGVGRGLGETVFVEEKEGEDWLKFADIYFRKK